ncbi:hypothetical protein GALL_280490 [mine drainage metagenome]|uniref:Uncharacterized protein n=1 Tax=mine drainage metagenome TaxID=410659 RepID=A0A1J5R3M3_9ZZZZ
MPNLAEWNLIERNLVSTTLAVVLLSACSPYVYNREITSFANGVGTVVSIHQTGEQTIANQIAQQQQAAHVAAKDRLDLLPGCDSVDPSGNPPKLADCAVAKFGDKQRPQPPPVQAHLASDEPLFAALKAYAAALAAVSNAADDTTLAQATQGLTSAAGGLTGAVAKLVPTAPNSTLVTSAGSLLGQGIALYLDSRRYAVLRAIVPVVDPSIATLGQTVEADLRLIRAHQIAQLQKGLHADVAPLQAETVSTLDRSDYQTKLAALQTKVAVFNQARAADPREIANAMVSAHHQLAAALQGDSGQIVPILTAVSSFSTAADQMKAAVDAAAGATGTVAATK